MASRILLPSRLPMFVGFGASSLLLSPLSPLMQRRVLHLDSSPVSASPKDWSFSQYERDAKVPVVKKRGGLNPKAVKQFTTGSILGLVGGLAVSTFSKSLALLIGLMIFGVQALESRGIHLIPYGRMQRYVKSVDLRSAVQDNVAFKLAFGATFALVGFADFSSN